MDIFTPASQGNSVFQKLGIFIVLFISSLFAASQPTSCSITSSTAQLTVCTNETVMFSSTVSGIAVSYSWDFAVNNSGASIVSGQGTPSISVNTGVMAGDFTLRLTVVTTAGSSVCEYSLTVNALNIQPSFTPINCFGSTSTISVTSNGTDVTYTLLPMNISNGTGTFPGITAGNYEVNAIDAATGCSTSAVIVIPQPSSLLQATSVVGHNLCFGQGIGSVNLTVSGGVPPYSYTWAASNGGMIPPGQMNNEDLIQLFAGDYTVSITDAAGCVIEHLATVGQPEQLLAQASATHVVCWGSSTGEIDLTIMGGVQPYSYEWQGSWGGVVPAGMENSEDLTGLTPGFYEVLVRDANNCSVSKSVVVNGPSTGLATSYTRTNVGCAGGATGAIDLNVSNGFPPYTYSWSASNGGFVPAGQESLEDISGLVTGTYTCVVTDSINCTTTRSVNIIQVNSGSLTVTGSTINPSCFGDNNGAINIQIDGNPAGIIYNWSASAGGVIPAGQENTEDISGLVAGTYTVTANLNGCTGTQTFTLSQPLQLAASVTSSAPPCAGEPGGSIETSVTGGISPLTFQWVASNGGSIPAGQEGLEDLTGLTAGTYSVTITDANGCSISPQDIVLQDATPIDATLNVTNIVICNTASGAIDLTPSGGSGNFSFEWAATAGGSVPADQVNNEDITGLIPGLYHVNVTDGSGCTITFTATVTENCGGPLPCSLTASVQSENISCYGEQDGQIEVTATGGQQPYTISWSATNGGSILSGQQASFSLTDLPAGTYSYEIISSDGCNINGVIEITAPDAPLTIQETHTNVACGNGTGSINVTVSGGTAPYSYQWSTFLVGNIPAGQSTNEDLTGLTAGIYYLRVIDANGCLKTKVVLITNVFSNIEIQASVTQPACAGNPSGSINITPSGGAAPYTFSWTATDGGIIPAGQEDEEDLTGLVPGKYKVVVSDANGCQKSRNFNLSGQYTLQVAVQRQNVQGCGESNGSINISHTNVGGPYTYSWVATNGGVIPANQVNNQDLSGIPSGTYTVTIMNAAGCITIKEIVITQDCTPPSYGCGHGYWKNHPEHWNQFSDPVVNNMPATLRFITTSNFYTYFNISSVNGLPANLTMLGALELGGGGCRAFVRTAVKALLVIASGQNVSYPAGTSNFTQVYNAIRNALISGQCNGSLRQQLDHLCNSNDDDDDDDDRSMALAENLDVQAFPNPFVNEIRFSINSDHSGEVTLELFGLTGEKLSVTRYGSLKGNRTITYRVPENLRRSMIYVIRVGEKMQTGKLIYLN